MISEDKNKNDGFFEKPKKEIGESLVKRTFQVWVSPGKYHEIEASSIIQAQAKCIDEYGVMPIAISPGKDEKGRPLPPHGFQYVEDKDE